MKLDEDCARILDKALKEGTVTRREAVTLMHVDLSSEVAEKLRFAAPWGSLWRVRNRK